MKVLAILLPAAALLGFSAAPPARPASRELVEAVRVAPDGGRVALSVCRTSGDGGEGPCAVRLVSLATGRVNAVDGGPGADLVAGSFDPADDGLLAVRTAAVDAGARGSDLVRIGADGRVATIGHVAGPALLPEPGPGRAITFWTKACRPDRRFCNHELHRLADGQERRLSPDRFLLVGRIVITGDDAVLAAAQPAGRGDAPPDIVHTAWAFDRAGIRPSPLVEAAADPLYPPSQFFPSSADRAGLSFFLVPGAPTMRLVARRGGLEAGRWPLPAAALGPDGGTVLDLDSSARGERVAVLTRTGDGDTRVSLLDTRTGRWSDLRWSRT